MECQQWDKGLEYVKRFEEFEVEPGGVREGSGSGDFEELVVDSDEEMVKEEAYVGKRKKKSVNDEKAVKALKNHSEAERRRRERINGHLATLRGMLASNEKMDKATLLAEVINQVKDLQEHAREVSKGLAIPMDADELIVEPLHNGYENGVTCFRATLNCDFRTDLFADLKQAVQSLKLKTLHSEISTLEGRVKTLFIFSSYQAEYIDNPEAHNNLRSSILQALSSVLYKPSPLPEYSPRTTLSQKRFTPSSFDIYLPGTVIRHKRLKYSLSSSTFT